MFWLNLGLLVLLTAGHSKILVTVVNRLHARPMPERWLRHLRHAHDAAILGFFPLILWRVGFGGAGLLTGGRWGELSLGWKFYFAACAVGAAGLAASSLRWWLKRVPALQLSNHSHTVDVAKKLGRAPVGDGPYRFLTRVPGNEIFRIEVSEKRYRLPRLPREWHGLSILHLSDLHFLGTVDRPYFEEVAALSAELQPELIVFTGDLLDRQELVDWLPSTLGKLTAPLGCYYILGNHDWFLEPDAIRDKMNSLGWRDLAGRTATLERGGQSLVLGGTERPWMGTHPDYSSAAPGAFRVLLSHTPDNLPWARAQKIDLMLSGHNHGGQVVLPLLGPIYSPSRYGVRFAGGVFYEEPTALYVSRGVSARHPLRWNCLPELTKLVLESPLSRPLDG